jgi:hypothetical protein
MDAEQRSSRCSLHALLIYGIRKILRRRENHLRDLDVDDRIEVKWILKKLAVRM